MKPCKLTTANDLKKFQAIISNSNDYFFEEKLDGISCTYEDGKLFSNLGTEKTDKFPQIVKPLLDNLGTDIVLDGELYIHGWKCNQVVSITNCGTEESLAKQAIHGYMEYHVYDILRDTDGTDMTVVPFEKRRARLEEIFRGSMQHAEYVKLNPIWDIAVDDVMAKFDEVVSAGLEGIVLKKKDGLYMCGKRPKWNQIKLKASYEDDVVVVGFAEPNKAYTGKDIEHWPYWEDGQPVTQHWYEKLVGSIIIGKYKDGELITVGRVSGITETLRKDMTLHPNNYIGRVIKIKGMEKTTEGNYRHFNFKGFHPDKRAEECIYEVES